MSNEVKVTDDECQSFSKNGFLVKKRLLSSELLKQVGQEVEALLHKPTEPLELEVNVGYPGAPKTSESEGGRTIRRVLSLCSRSEMLKNLAIQRPIGTVLEHLFSNNTPISLNQNHHNCLMTKAPSYSSDTHWHQDIRYWSFEQPNLISAWIALGAETQKNGALQVIPGSHEAKFDADQFDSDKFFLDRLERNQPWLSKKTQLELEAGDVLFFDSRLLHKATRNATDEVKLSLVFTYHDATNAPLANTRSEMLDEIQLASQYD